MIWYKYLIILSGGGCTLDGENYFHGGFLSQKQNMNFLPFFEPFWTQCQHITHLQIHV